MARRILLMNIQEEMPPMRLDDPRRPKFLNGLPMYMDQNEEPVSPLPRITILALPEGLRVSIMAKVGWNDFTEFFAEGIYSEMGIIPLLILWNEDPEYAMRKFFGYVPPAGHSTKRRSNGFGAEVIEKAQNNGGKPELTLDDLL
jgi:hypothetical protein